DIGKIYIPESVLRKDSSLSDEEWVEMRKHPEVGALMIRDIPYLAPAIPLVLHHHERWDGNGYPAQLNGEEIPEGARLLAVADAFDAMTSDRPYRQAMPGDVAYTEIRNGSGKQFDPGIVQAMEKCWDSGEIHRIMDNSNESSD
ncbi:MAG: HD domain-containing protein, partial [Anaerolineales bacterium]|nr:HD domain-containing protein [Anaerolineales bacterium]